MVSIPNSEHLDIEGAVAITKNSQFYFPFGCRAPRWLSLAFATPAFAKQNQLLRSI